MSTFRKLGRGILTKQNRFPIILTLIHFSTLIVLMTHHEMWRDELQAWDIARNSTNLMELFDNLRYEGNPGLWHLLLFPLTKITRYPWIMQAFHAVIASSTVFIVAKFSPFSKLQKILFAAGYFTLFEYAVISRNYALGVFFFFLTLVLYCKRKVGNIKTALSTVALSLTSIYGTILSGIFLTLLVFDIIQNSLLRRGLPKLKQVLPHSIIITGILLSLLLSLPPRDNGFDAMTRTNFNLLEQRRTVTKIWQTYAPIPEDRTLFWNSNIIYERERQYDLTLVIGALTLIAMANCPSALLMYLSGTLSLLLFSYIKYPGELRHNGHLFLIFIGSIWLAEELGRKWKYFLVQQKIRWNLLTIILIFQIFATFIAIKNDWLSPFTPSKGIAQYIDVNYPGSIIIGDRDSHVSGIAMHLDKEIYYTQTKRLGSFIVWDRDRQTGPHGQEPTLDLAQNIYNPNKPLLLVLDYKLVDAESTELLYQAGETAINKRTLYVYRYEPK